MKATNPRRRRLPEHIAQAMTAILEFFWQSEASDYVCGGPKEQQEHIFNKMIMVRQWLAGNQKNTRGGEST